MPLHNSTFGLSLATTLLAFSGSALAGITSPGTAAFHAADVDSSGSLSPLEFDKTLPIRTTHGKATLQFKKADRDRSGSISLSEYLVYVGEQAPPTKEELSFKVADEDASGFIDIEEFTANTVTHLAPTQIRLRFLRADADENDLLSPEEWTLFKKGKAKGKDGVKYTKFFLADLDEDNELTLDEFALTYRPGVKKATIAKTFAKKDKNEDSVLTRDEWNPGAPKQPL